MSETDVIDVEPEDGWDDERGLERCPVCERGYSGNGLYIGPVYDLDGNRYETYLDTDPDDRPFPCEECWEEIETEVRARNHRTLDDFGVDR
jgi:hypothetical protein